jgi:hypothetical protein
MRLRGSGDAQERSDHVARLREKVKALNGSVGGQGSELGRFAERFLESNDLLDYSSAAGPADRSAPVSMDVIIRVGICLGMAENVAGPLETELMGAAFVKAFDDVRICASGMPQHTVGVTVNMTPSSVTTPPAGLTTPGGASSTTSTETQRPPSPLFTTPTTTAPQSAATTVPKPKKKQGKREACQGESFQLNWLLFCERDAKGVIVLRYYGAGTEIELDPKSNRHPTPSLTMSCTVKHCSASSPSLSTL